MLSEGNNKGNCHALLLKKIVRRAVDISGTTARRGGEGGVTRPIDCIHVQRKRTVRET